MKPADLSNTERLALELGHAGRNAVVYIDEDRNADRPITLHTYRPYGHTPDRPVVIVQHGVMRNGDDYRDFWVPAADKHKLLIVAPTFSNEIWPGVESYNNGLAYTAMGNPRHVDGWSYALPARVVADLVAAELVDGNNTYLFGHSAGGVTAVIYTLEHQSELAGLVCESFAYQVPAPDFAIAALKGLSHLAPHAHVLALPNKAFSRDATVVAMMDADPLIAHESQPTRTVAALAIADDRLKREFPLITLPVFILHGTADKATKPSGSQEFFANVGSTDKTLKLYDGHFHDMLNDIGKEEVLADITSWIEARV